MQWKINWCRLRAIAFICCSFIFIQLNAQDTVYVGKGTIDLNKSLLFCIDSSQQKSVSEIDDLLAPKENFSNAGLLIHPIWLKYTLTFDQSLEKVVYLSNPDIREVTFYILDEDGQILRTEKTGRAVDQNFKNVSSRYPAIKLQIKKGQTIQLYIKIENKNYPMYFPLMLLNEKDFYKKNTNEIIIESIFLGLLTMTMLIVIGIYYWVKRRQFIFYALALLLIISFYVAEAGFFIELNFGDWFQDRVKYVTTSLLMVFMTLFIREGIPFYSKAKIMVKIIWGMNIFHIIFAISVLFIPVSQAVWFNPYQMIYFLTVQLYGVLFLVGLAWEAMYKNKMALYGFMGYFFFVVTSIVKMMVINGVMEFSWAIFAVLKIGSLIEIGIFNFLIFIQIKAWYDERNTLMLEVNTHQQDLMEALVEGEERERKRLSEELHDSVGSMLSALKLNMPSIKNLKGLITENEQQKIEKGVTILDNTLTEVRNLSHALQPPNLKSFGLEAELKQYVQRVETDAFKIHLRFDSWPKLADQNLCLALFRIVQEGINNTVKHAKAKNLSIQFRGEKDALILTIEDDGIGFDMNVRQFGIGVKNMKSRISNFPSTFHLESAPGQGTLIMITITEFEISHN